MPLPTPSQSVSHKWFHHCMNHKKKLNLRHPLTTFGSFSFFQASIWLRVDKVLPKLTKSYKSELRHLFQWFPGNVRVNSHFNTQCPPDRVSWSDKIWGQPSSDSPETYISGHELCYLGYIQYRRKVWKIGVAKRNKWVKRPPPSLFWLE